jgi:hypothetical protein
MQKMKAVEKIKAFFYIHLRLDLNAGLVNKRETRRRSHHGRFPDRYLPANRKYR